MRYFSAFTTSLCAVLLLAWSAVPSAQSLAEIARKEQQRRKTVKGTSKVYTNEDLDKYPDAAESDKAGGKGAATTPDADKAKARPKPAVPAVDKKADVPDDPANQEPVKDEKYWRARITSARRDLERNDVFLDALQTRVNSLTTDFVNRDDPAQRAAIGSDRQRALAEIERVRGDIQRLTTEIAAIEEEARRSGVPPGWLR
jgi:hypothetical protein